MILDWQTLSPEIDALLELKPKPRAERLSMLQQTDPERARALLHWLAAIDQSEGEWEFGIDVPATTAPEGLGPWRALALVGRGGMGEVWRGERADGAFARTVAIKLLRLDRAAAADSIARERALLARLDHPGIARLLDGGISAEGRAYLVMDWVEGLPLDAWLEQARPSLRERVQRLREIALAVAEAHSRLIVHRDLKPANVLIDANGRPRVLDFGIARLFDAETHSALTLDTALTPAFAAPEQLAGAPASTRSDVYALGALLYLALCGRHPHGAAHLPLAELVERVCNQDPQAPSRLEPAAAIDRDLDAICLAALQREPAQRTASAEALAADLQRWLDGETVSSRRPNASERARRWLRRHRLLAALAAGLLLSLLGGLGTSLALLAQARAERATALTELARSQSLRDGLVAAFRDADTRQSGPAEFWLDRILDEARGSTEPEQARQLLEQLAELEFDRSQPTRAKALYSELLQNHSGALSTESRARAECSLARAHSVLGELPQAAELAAAGRARAETLQGAARSTLVFCLGQAIAGDGSSPSPDARADVERGLTELDALQPVSDHATRPASRLHWQRAGLLHTLGLLCDLQGDYPAARKAYEAAIALNRERGGNSPELAIDLTSYAGVLGHLGQHTQAADLASESLRILDQLSIDSGVSRGNAALELGRALEAQGRFEAADAALALAGPAFAAELGEQHAYLRFVELMQARVRLGRGDIEGARGEARRLLAGFVESGSVGAQAGAQSLLATIESRAGRAEPAERAAQAAFDLQSQRGPAGHWRIAAARAELGLIQLQSNPVSAQAQLQMALPVLRAQLGSVHPRVLDIEAALAAAASPGADREQP